jgi:hypothetical protein
LQPLSRVALAAQPNGSPVLIEGRIAASNPPQYRDLVAYTRERASSDGRGGTTWTYAGEQTPPLQIDLPDGPVAIANIGYDINAAPHEYRSNGERSLGFVAGDPVMVVGRVTQSPTGPTIAADFVSGDGRAAYIERYRSSAGSTGTLGRWALIAGLGCLALAALAWWLTRPRQRVSGPSGAP